MTARKKKVVYYCRHCGYPWEEHYLADLCFKIDMDNLVKGKEELKNGKNKKYKKK